MKGLQEFYFNTEGGGEAGDSSGGAVPSDGGSVGADVSTSEHVNPDGGVVPEAPATENSAEGTWFEKATPEQAAFIKNKGWGDDPLRAIAGYRELEKFVGKDPERVLEIPREDDPEGSAAFWAKLGAGKEASDYAFDFGEDGTVLDQGYLEHMQEQFKEMGVPVSMAQKIAKANNDYLAERAAQGQEAYKQQVEADRQALQKEWGVGAEKSMAQAKAAAQKLQIPPEAVDAIEAKLGYANTIKMFAKLGSQLVEDGYVTGNSNAFNGQLTPAEAKSALESFNALDSNRAALADNTHPAHNKAVAERRRLIAMAFPDE